MGTLITLTTLVGAFAQAVPDPAAALSGSEADGVNWLMRLAVCLALLILSAIVGIPVYAVPPLAAHDLFA